MQSKDPETLLFQDDGTIPNSKYPPAAVPTGVCGPRYPRSRVVGSNLCLPPLDQLLALGRVSLSPLPRQHPRGTWRIQWLSVAAVGRRAGQAVQVQAGDVIVIPAGVGHKCLRHSDDFRVVGAYPDGLSPDLRKGEPGDRPEADENLSQVPLPATDPLYGAEAGLRKIWK